MQKSICLISLLLSVAVLILPSCGSPNPNDMFATRFDTQIKKLAVLYSTFQARNSWTGPADEAEFRKYIDGVSETRLERLDITKSEVDGLFQSERDGQPYRIRWGIAGGNGAAPKPILFEADGSQGNYMVGFTNGTSQEFSKEDYDKLWDGQGDDGSFTGFNAAQGRQ